MREAIAVASGVDSEVGRDRGDECRCRRREATVMRNDQHIRLEELGHALDERELAAGLEVAGEQDAPVGRVDADDAREIVRLDTLHAVESFLWLQQREAY